jgi:hypothetical protein
VTRPLTEDSALKQQANYGYRIRQLERRPSPRSVPIYCIKVFSDEVTVITGDGRFIFAIDEDVGGRSLTKVEIYVTTVSSSGIVRVQIRNITGAGDMLSTRVQIDAGEFHSKDASTVYVINVANATVAHGDRIAIDVDDAGTGAKGLGVSLTF